MHDLRVLIGALFAAPAPELAHHSHVLSPNGWHEPVLAASHADAEPFVDIFRALQPKI